MTKFYLLYLLCIISTYGFSQTALLEQKVADLEKRVNNLEEKMGKTYEQRIQDLERQLKIGEPKDTKIIDGVKFQIVSLEGDRNNGNLKICMMITNEDTMDKKNFYAQFFEFTDLSGISYSMGNGYANVGFFINSKDQYKDLMRNTPYQFEIVFKNVKYSEYMKGAKMHVNIGDKRYDVKFADIRINWTEE